MASRRDSTAVRNQQGRAVRAKALIAANLEDCLQDFDRLCAALRANRQGSEEYVAAENCRSRLTSWAHDSGASGRALDHSLRRSSSLRGITLNLLIDLHATLQEGKIGCFMHDTLEGPLRVL